MRVNKNMPTYGNKNFRNIGTGGTNIYQRIQSASAGGGGISVAEVVNLQYPANGTFGDGVNWPVTHTLNFATPSVSVDSIAKIGFDFSVMAHCHIYGTVNSIQGWYRATSEVEKIPYAIPIVDVTAKGNHSVSTNYKNPYGTSYEYNGSWYWENASAVSDPVINDSLEPTFDNHFNGKQLTLNIYTIGQYSTLRTLESVTCTINSDGSVTAVLQQPTSGYDGQVLAANASIIYYS